MVHENVDAQCWPHPPEFEDLPSSVLRLILSHSLGLSTPLGSNAESVEIRCCRCLDDKTFPFRAGDTHILIDDRTDYDVRVSINPCETEEEDNPDTWCCKKYIPHVPGIKNWIPALALTCATAYNDWRDLPIWVFCSEHCFDVALRSLPSRNQRLFSHVRLFERAQHPDIPVLSKECYDFDGFTDLTYVSGPNKQIEYKGKEVWVKDMWRVSTEGAMKLEEEASKAQKKRKREEEEEEAQKKLKLVEKSLQGLVEEFGFD